MKTCYIYTRTATATQEEQSNGSNNAIALQVSECKKYARENGYKAIKIFKDIGFSGNNYKRKALQQLLTDCKEHSVDAVIVLNTDRLSRNFTDYQKIRSLIQKVDIQLITVNEGDLSTPAGGLIGGIVVSIAQYESERSLEK